MKSKKNKESSINELSSTDKDSLKYMTDKLEKLRESSEITEDSIGDISGVVLELLGMQNRHQTLLRRWIKQGYISD